MGQHERSGGHSGGCFCAYYAFADLLFRIEALEMSMATQQDQINKLADELVSSESALQQEITALQEQNPQLDLTSLQSAVQSVANLATGLAPAPTPAPAPAPDPTPDPTPVDPTPTPDPAPVDPTPVDPTDPTQGGTVDPTVPVDNL